MSFLIVSPYVGVELALLDHRPEGLISIIDQDKKLSTPYPLTKRHHLHLNLHDIYEKKVGMIHPQRHHIDTLIRFFCRWTFQGPLLIHCLMGVSRSMAAAVIGMAIWNPDKETEILQIVRQIAPYAKPNPLMIYIADKLLGYEGRLFGALLSLPTCNHKEQGNYVCINPIIE